LLATFVATESVPAPSAIVLLALGLIGIALNRKPQHS